MGYTQRSSCREPELVAANYYFGHQCQHVVIRITEKSHPDLDVAQRRDQMRFAQKSDAARQQGLMGRVDFRDGVVDHRCWMIGSNAVDPGWVPTRMGGAGAPDDLVQGHETQVWLAASDDRAARASGRYWYHREPRAAAPQALDPRFQDELMDRLAALTGLPFP
jgi:hypothetical protein